MFVITIYLFLVLFGLGMPQILSDQFRQVYCSASTEALIMNQNFGYL